jgi:hypothetical protein
MLAVDGQDRGRRARARSEHQRAGADQAFLVGQRQRRALPQRRSPGASPAAPTMADITQSAGRPAASTRARARPRPRSRCRQRRAQIGSRSGWRSPRSRRAASMRILGQPRDVAAPGQRHHLVGLGRRARSGRWCSARSSRSPRRSTPAASDRPPGTAGNPSFPCSDQQQDSDAPIIPSNRSSTPPWPGIRSLRP